MVGIVGATVKVINWDGLVAGRLAKLDIHGSANTKSIHTSSPAQA